MSYSLQFGKSTTLSAQMTISEVTSGTLAASVFTNFTADYLVIDYDVPAKREVIKCNVTGTAIASITRGQEGTSAVQHEIGAKVGYNFVPTHYADVTANGVLGYAQVTTPQGSISSSGVDLTDLTSTVTVPAGGRKVRITMVGTFTSDTQGRWTEMYIMEGGTVLKTGFAMHPTGLYANGSSVSTSVILTPTPGSHTYKLHAGSSTAGTTVTLAASTTDPAFILVEYLGGV